jgi:hypothetical protein
MDKKVSIVEILDTLAHVNKMMILDLLKFKRVE